MEYFILIYAIVGLIFIAIYLEMAIIIGSAAKEKGYSNLLYFLISIFASPFIGGFMVFFLVMTQERILEKMFEKKKLDDIFK